MSRHVYDAKGLAIVAVLLGVGGFQSSSQEATRPPRTIFGTYGNAAAGHDSIRINEKAAGAIGVTIRLYFAGGHMCWLNADGGWRDNHVAIVTDGLTPAQSCRLNVFFDRGRVQLMDEGYQCAPVYCGTRGRLDGASLPKSRANR